MKRRYYLVAFCATTLFGASAHAQAPNERSSPSAAIFITKKNVGTLRWYGVGDLRSKNNICVLSDTGRYRLRLEVIGLGQNESTPAFEIAFSTMAGDDLVRRSTDGNVLFFDGRTGPTTSCDGVSNATLEFRFTSAGLSSAVAGAYLERVHITVDPA